MDSGERDGAAQTSQDLSSVSLQGTHTGNKLKWAMRGKTPKQNCSCAPAAQCLHLVWLKSNAVAFKKIQFKVNQTDAALLSLLSWFHTKTSKTLWGPHNVMDRLTSYEVPKGFLHPPAPTAQPKASLIVFFYLFIYFYIILSQMDPFKSKIPLPTNIRAVSGCERR